MPDPEQLSVYQRALGARFAELDPGLLTYFSLPPAGHVGVGEGVYEVAGSRHRWLRPVFAYLGRRQVLFPERGHDIRFRVVNRPLDDGTLAAERLFVFPKRDRVLVDRIDVAGGVLRDRLGRRGGLEVELVPDVVAGGLRMSSRRQWVRLRRLRVRIPAVVRVTLDERAEGGRQRVDVRLTAPVLGEVFRYAGTFDYRTAPAAEVSTSGPRSEPSRR